MLLRTLTVGGPWEVVAAENADGTCSLESELERMLDHPATADAANAFRSQFQWIVQEGPSVFTNHVFEYVDEPIFAFKRKRFRAVGFLVERRLVLCHIVELAGRSRVPAELIASARAVLAEFRDNEQRKRRGLFRLN